MREEAGGREREAWRDGIMEYKRVVRNEERERREREVEFSGQDGAWEGERGREMRRWER